MAATSISTLTPTTQTFYNKLALERLIPQFRFYEHTDKQVITENSGRTMSLRRYTNLATVTTPLSEATDPTNTSIASTEVTATILEYGAYTTLTGLVSTTDIDPQVKTAVSDVLMTQMSQTLDELVRTEMNAQSQVRIANGKSTVTLAATDVFTSVDLRKCLRDLRAANALPYEGEKYHAILHPSQVYDLKADAATGSWTDLYKYNQNETLVNGDKSKGYVGQLDGCEIYATSLVDTEVINTFTAYRAHILAKGAYGSVEIGKSSDMKITVHGPGTSGIADPLDRFTTVGWYTKFVAKSLDATAASSKNARAFVLKTTVSA